MVTWRCFSWWRSPRPLFFWHKEGERGGRNGGRRGRGVTQERGKREGKQEYLGMEREEKDTKEKKTRSKKNLERRKR